MKKIALIIAVCTSIIFACKKEDKTVEPTQATTPSTPTCTTCPYCVQDSVITDTVIHMKVTIDDTVNFVASTLWDTVIGNSFIIKGKNSFVSGTPEIKIYVSQNDITNSTLGNGLIGDTTTTSYITYKINAQTFHSKKGKFNIKEFIMQGNGVTTPHYLQKYSSTFCFNTDTINGVSHKIKLGSVKIKHP